MVKKSEIFFYFLKLGFTGFGGPVALAAMMQSELVEEKGWVSRHEFDRAFPLIKAMPGSLAIQTASYITYRCSGVIGAILASVGLLFPASMMMVALAIFSTTMSELAWLQPLMIGFQAGALALIFLACLQLAVPYKTIRVWWVFVIAALGLSFAQVPEPLLIIAFGVVNISLAKQKRFPKVLLSVPLFELMAVCVTAGVIVFGTGLAAIPWLEKQMVFRNAWISQHEFLQAVAFGQITPGPVLVAATYIGYKTTGLLGAIVATISIYLPGLINMTTWFPRVMNRLANKSWIGDFSEGALAGVVGTLIYVVLRYLPALGVTGLGIFILASAILYKFRLPSWMVIILSGVAAYFAGFFQI